MSHYLVSKSALKGEIHIPSSKSQTLRAILFGAMADGKSLIHNYLPSNDTQAMVGACRLFGAKLNVAPNKIEIQGVKSKIHSCENVIHAGNSGIILRFCTGIAALAQHPVVITGDYSIRYHRPMHHLLDGLNQLGVSAKSMRGDHFAPVIIQGPIKSGNVTIAGEDSQPVSALLIAAAFADRPIEINVKNAGEKPWLCLTLNWLDRLGISYKNQQFENFHLSGKARYDGFEYSVPGDLSSAAFPIAAALITGSELTLKNTDMRDCQGDKELISVFQQMGARIEIDESAKSLHVKKGTSLSGITVDINNFVDAISILAVVACFAEGETCILNAAIARQKECNRILCTAAELRKMGADITETDDGLVIRKSELIGAHVHSHHDHRLAMSLAVAALGSKGETQVSSVECVSKTFPGFLEQFNALGANIREMP